MVKLLAGAAVLVAAATGGFFLLRSCGDPDIRQIRRTLNEALETAEVHARENQLAAAAHARRLGRFVTPDVTFGNRTMPVVIESRENLMMAVLQARTILSQLAIDPHDIEIELRSDRKSALMTLSAHITADGPAGPETAWKNVRVEWTKQDDQWLVARVQAVEPIEQPW
jgi:ketosteroid isomerase-like protein